MPAGLSPSDGDARTRRRLRRRTAAPSRARAPWSPSWSRGPTRNTC